MRGLFKFFAFLAGLAAAYHLVGLFHPVNSSPAWRHALFVAIDVVCIVGLLRRPAWFKWIFSILAVQQIIGHGSTFLRAPTMNVAAWLDLGVMLFVILAAVCLHMERGGRKA